MKHLFVPYELALLAKEKGFNEPCLAWFDKDGDIVFELRGAKDSIANKNEYFKSAGCSAPLYQQLVDWFREQRILIHVRYSVGSKKFFTAHIHGKEDIIIDRNHLNRCYYSAFNASLTEAFKLI